MKHLSFALTTPQFKARTKLVTRRVGWKDLKAGTLLQGVEKGQGLKKGETVVQLGVIRVVDVRRERLSRMTHEREYGQVECVLEGFPDLTPHQFVAMFAESHGLESEGSFITRIEFEYIDRSPTGPRRRRAQGGKVADPAFRRARAERAGEASRVARHARATADAERFDSKAQAYAAGYRSGYQTASRWFRHRRGAAA